MTRDWSFTLLALSPFLFAATAATMVVLALVRRLAQDQRARSIVLVHP